MPRIKSVLAALANAGLSACTLAGPAPAACPSQTSAAAEAGETMREMYAALKRDDYAAFHAVTSADFLAFDGGQRFEGDALIDLIKAQHEKGVIYDWQISDPKVEATCNIALVTYLNTGSVTSSGATRDVAWLESATLMHDGRRWRIRFFHSTRVPQS